MTLKIKYFMSKAIKKSISIIIYLKKNKFFAFLGHVHFKKFLIISEIGQKPISFGKSPEQ